MHLERELLCILHVHGGGVLLGPDDPRVVRVQQLMCFEYVLPHNTGVCLVLSSSFST